MDIPPNSLLVTSPQNYPLKNAQLVDSVIFLNGQIAFDFVRYE